MSERELTLSLIDFSPRFLERRLGMFVPEFNPSQLPEFPLGYAQPHRAPSRVGDVVLYANVHTIASLYLDSDVLTRRLRAATQKLNNKFQNLSAQIVLDEIQAFQPVLDQLNEKAGKLLNSEALLTQETIEPFLEQVEVVHATLHELFDFVEQYFLGVKFNEPMEPTWSDYSRMRRSVRPSRFLESASLSSYPPLAKSIYDNEHWKVHAFYYTDYMRRLYFGFRDRLDDFLIAAKST